MAEKANITPYILRWARESAKITEELAASKVSVPVGKLRDWETGSDQPTIRQAQVLFYFRSTGTAAFLPSISWMHTGEVLLSLP